MTLGTEPATHGFIDPAFSFRLESAEFLPSLDVIDTLKGERPELGAERLQVGGGWMTYAGPQSPLNHIIGLGLHGPVSAQELDQVEEFYFTRCSVCEVVVSPYADMSLVRLLGERGYRITEWNSVLFRSLSSGERFDTGTVEVHAVSAPEAPLWSEIVARGFADIATVPPDFFVPFATAQNANCFLAYVDGRPAGGAGGSLFPDQGLAPFYGTSTVPEFRQRGVHNALFQARLQAACGAGCELAVVCTQPGSSSQRNAERNGFRVAYTKVAMQRQV